MGRVAGGGHGGGLETEEGVESVSRYGQWGGLGMHPGKVIFQCTANTFGSNGTEDLQGGLGWRGGRGG